MVFVLVVALALMNSVAAMNINIVHPGGRKYTLTHFSLVSHKCVAELGSYWFSLCLFACLAPSHYLTHRPLGDLNVILKMSFSILLDWLVSSNLCMIMYSDNCHRMVLMKSYHWFRLCAIRQHAITWTSVDQDLQRHMASLGPNESNQWWLLINHNPMNTLSWK